MKERAAGGEEAMEQEAGRRGKEKVVRKRSKAGRGAPSSKKKRRQEESAQLLKVLLSSPGLSVEQVKKQMAAELDSIAQVCGCGVRCVCAWVAVCSLCIRHIGPGCLSG